MRTPADKVVERAALEPALAEHRRRGHTVVFTNGCFDLLHVGHLRTLNFARSQGDLLVVGLNGDDSVRALKGPTRPLVPEAERAEMLAGLECVDYVVIFAESTPIATLEWVRPAVHVKGGDYRPEQLPEAEVIERHGGRIELARLVPGRSTSLLEQHIAQSHHHRE